MYFKIKCPHCDKTLKVREDLSGRKCACPYCNNNVRVPKFSSGDSVLSTGSAADSPQINVNPGDSAGTTTANAGSLGSVSTGGWTDSSDVGLFSTGLLALAFTAIFYLLIFPFKDSYFGKLFVTENFVPYVLVFLFGWSISILFLKYRKLRRQQKAMLMDVLPTELSDEITLSTIDQFVTHIHGLPTEPGESYLINRVLRGFEHFRVRKSTAETVTMMNSQSEIDFNNVASSYTLLKVFIWAIPIMGFIGTVMGISEAVAGFSGKLGGSTEDLKASLNGVTGGLATAFDTTLVALVMSILIKFPTSSLQKSEEGLLNWVDEYCNESLLRRLNDGREGGAERGSGSGGINTAAFRQVVESVLATHQAELEKWEQKMRKVGTLVSTQVAEGWQDINEKMMSQQEAMSQKLRQSQENQVLELTQIYANQLKNAQEEQRQQSEIFQEQLKQSAELTQSLQTALATLANQSETLQNRMMESVNGSAESLQSHFSGIDKGLSSLTDVLERLGEQQVVVQQVERPRRGWFSFGGHDKKNGR